MKDNVTQVFIDDLYDMIISGFPDRVILQAKKCLLDYLGVTFAGAKTTEAKIKTLLGFYGILPECSSVIGLNKKANLQTSVLINGLNAHAVELDDGERFGMIHPGAPLFSALLPLAESERLSGKDLLTGIVIGYEAGIRIARTMQPHLKDRGYHATGVCGTVGVALGVGAALKFSKTELKNALSAAATTAAGILKVIEDGSELKPFNVGQAALSGITAAFLARAGFKGPDDVLTGERGFIPLTVDQSDLSHLKRDPQNLFCIENIYVKPYAACRHCHPPIEAALKIRSEKGIDPEKIEEIRVDTYRWAVKLHDHIEIDGVNSAKMSTPYSVAVALVTGRAGLEEFSPEMIKDQRVLALTRKVKVRSDDTLTALVPHKRAAEIEIATYENELYSERVDLPKGEPENPLTEEELKEKFISLALYGKKTEAEIDQIVKIVWDIEENLAKLFEFL